MEVESDTERMGMEEEPRISEESYESIFNSVSDAILLIDPTDYKVIRANKAALQQLKLDEKEVVGKTCYEVSHRRSSVCEPPDHVCPIGELMEKNTSVTVEHVHYDGDGDPFHVEVAASPVRDDEGNIVHIIHVSRDITERKKAEDALLDANDRWGSLTENTDDVIMIVDSEGTLQFVNKTPLTPNPKEAIGKKVYESIPREQHDILRESFGKVFKTGKPVSYEVSLDLPEVGTLWFSTKAVPIKHDGKVTGVILIATDITVRKKIEIALKENEERFKTFAEKSPSMLFVNVKGRIVYANKKCGEVTGYTREEFYSPDFDFLTLIAPEYQDAVKGSFTSHVKGEDVAPYEYALVTKEGSRVEVMLSTNLISYDGESAVLGILTDITERKKAEKARHELLHDYGERVKELKCLYGFSELVEKSEASLEETFSKFADLLPPAWQYPEFACARVMYGDEVFQTDNFRETPWRQRADIHVNGEKKGTVEVYYLEEMPVIHEGPFLREERELLDSLARKMGNYIERHEANIKLREMVKELRERDETLRLLENPLLEVADNVVALPLIGVVDSRRASTLMESLLNHVAERYAELVILDMTGILSVDTATAHHIMQTIEAVRLMGSDAVITGIRPDVAVTLATLGVELADIKTFSTLKEGLKHALDEG